MVIHVIKKLNNGTSWDKVTQSWRTASLIQELEIILKRFEYMIIKHVRREGNIEVDFLANWGSQEQGKKLDNIWTLHLEDSELEPLRIILNHDNHEDTIQRH